MYPETQNSVLLSVSQIVRADYRTADVFKKWGINYCCGGNLPLREVCAVKNLDLAIIENDLQEATKTVQVSNALAFNEWPVAFLVDYIVYVHHSYLKQTIPVLTQQILSFVSGHSNHYPYLIKVKETFLELTTVLMGHLQKEEEGIFPYIKQVSHTYDRKEVYGSLFVRTMRKPLAETVIDEQHLIRNLLLKLQEQTNQYKFNERVCTNHQVIYHKLKEFDADLVQHKHLENNILFPKVVEMEKALLKL